MCFLSLLGVEGVARLWSRSDLTEVFWTLDADEQSAIVGAHWISSSDAVLLSSALRATVWSCSFGLEAVDVSRRELAKELYLAVVTSVSSRGQHRVDLVQVGASSFHQVFRGVATQEASH